MTFDMKLFYNLFTVGGHVRTQIVGLFEKYKSKNSIL